MTFDEYEKKAQETVEYPIILVDAGDKDTEANYLYPVLGLVGEAGEVAEKIKKIIRNKKGNYTLQDIEEIKKELGDVLWYIQAVAKEFKISLDNIAVSNIAKLQDRQKRGVIKSEGDNR